MVHPYTAPAPPRAVKGRLVTAIVAWLVVTPASQAAQPTPQYPPRRLSDGGLMQRGRGGPTDWPGTSRDVDVLSELMKGRKGSSNCFEARSAESYVDCGHPT
jgi:hypothetical protein